MLFLGDSGASSPGLAWSCARSICLVILSNCNRVCLAFAAADHLRTGYASVNRDLVVVQGERNESRAAVLIGTAITLDRPDHCTASRWPLAPHHSRLGVLFPVDFPVATTVGFLTVESMKIGSGVVTNICSPQSASAFTTRFCLTFP